MVRLRLVHSVPNAPADAGTVDRDPAATRVTAALLDAARFVPRQPEVIRARAIIRARAALAAERAFAAVGAIRQPRTPRLRPS